MRLQGDVAVVTGAGRGIGSQIARRLAEESAHVVIADLDEASAQKTVEAINAAGGRARAIGMDVRKPEDAQRVVEFAASEFGRLDILVNNAGVGLNRPFLETKHVDWQRVLDVNLTGTFVCS